MKIQRTMPKGDGFRMPAEFEPHDGCIIIWPERGDSWPYGGIAARRAFVNVADKISASEKVTVCVSNEQYKTARTMLPEQVRVIEMSSNDAWARDYAPTFVVDKKGGRRGISWSFNAWGGLQDGLYFPWDKDDDMAWKLCDLLEVDVYDASDFVLEGGSIHVDGEGTAITTESCLLSPGRNPDLTKEEIEHRLKDYLDVEKVIWLKHGIYRDETNEHVDNICAFTAPGEVVLAWTDDTSDPQYEMSRSCYESLLAERDAKGRRFKIHKLPLPKQILVTEEQCIGLELMDGEPVREPGERLAASYVNFYIANHAVLLPAFGDEADQLARDIIAELFPDREVIQIPALDILIGGGNIHCITQQIPTGKGEDR